MIQEKFNKTTKVLHWLMAIFFIWMMVTAGSKFFINKIDELPYTTQCQANTDICNKVYENTMAQELKPLVDSIWSTHKQVGFIVLLLAISRILWTLNTLKTRPKSDNKIVSFVHLGMYLLMFTIPFIAFLRQYGSGRSFDFFGIEILSGDPSRKIQWMIDLAGTYHGLLGWTLFAIIIGHMFMALYHYTKDQHLRM